MRTPTAVLIAAVAVLVLGAGSTQLVRRAAQTNPEALASVRFATAQLLAADRALHRLPAVRPAQESVTVDDPGQRAIRAAAVRGTWDDSQYAAHLDQVERDLRAATGTGGDAAEVVDEVRFVAGQWPRVALDGDRAQVVVRGHLEQRRTGGAWAADPDALWQVSLVRTEGVSGSVRGWRLLSVSTSTA